MTRFEHQEAQQGRDRQPQAGDVKQAPAAAGGEQRGADRRRRNENPHADDADQQDTEIIRPTPVAAGDQRTARRADFPQRHRRENDGEEACANRELDERVHQANEEAARCGLLIYRPSNIK